MGIFNNTGVTQEANSVLFAETLADKFLAHASRHINTQELTTRPYLYVSGDKYFEKYTDALTHWRLVYLVKTEIEYFDILRGLTYIPSIVNRSVFEESVSMVPDHVRYKEFNIAYIINILKFYSNECVFRLVDSYGKSHIIRYPQDLDKPCAITAYNFIKY